MHALLSIARREVSALFLTATAWGALAVLTLMTGVIAGVASIVPGAPAEIRAVAAAAGWAMLLVAPAISLRPTTEDRRSGFWEVLATSPTGPSVLVLGRWLAGMVGVLALVVVGVGAPFTVLELLADPDLGECLCAALGVLLLGSAALASGVFFGSLTTSASVAYLSTFFFWLVVLIGLRSVAPALSADQADILFAADPIRRLEGFLTGAVDSADVIYFLALTFVFLAGAWALQRTDAERASGRTPLAVQLRIVSGVLAGIVIAVSACTISRAPFLRAAVDLTKGRQWVVAPQLSALLRGAKGPWRVTWIDPGGALSGGVGEQLEDVLAALDRSAASEGAEIAWTRIDPAVQSVAKEYAQWVDALIRRHRSANADSGMAVDSGCAEMERLASFAASESDRLGAVIDRLPDGSADRLQLERVRSAMRALAIGTPAILRTISAMRVSRPDRALPDAGEAAMVVAMHNRDWGTQLGAFSSWLVERGIANDAAPEIVELAQRIRPELGVRARALLRTVDAIDALEPDPLQDVSVGLATGGGLVIESPHGVAYISDAALAVNASDASSIVRFDRRFRMEQLIDASMRSILDDARPELILVHAEERSLLLPTGDGSDVFAIADACRAARIEVREWQVTATPQPIARPMSVWMVVPPRTVALERDARERALLEALAGLIVEGKPLMLSIGPSLRPLAGRPDPWAEAAFKLGAAAQTDSVIVDDIPTGEGKSERRTRVELLAGPSDLPIARALADQLVGVQVAIPVLPARASMEAAELLLAPVAPARSIERDWRRRSPDPRSVTPLADGMSVAVASERATVGGTRARALVIGSPSWMFTSVVDAARTMAGSGSVLVTPGNRELAVNGTLWLAGLDARLGDSGSARQASRIGEISVRERLQWTAGLSLMLPSLLLCIGVVIRWWRSRG